MSSKMLVKVFLSILICLFLSGCTARYEVTINNDSIEDNIFVIESNKKIEEATDDETDTFYNKLGDFEKDFDFYQRELGSDVNNTWYKYNYNFNFDEYDVMSVLGRCYDNFSLKTDKTIKLETGKKFSCFEYYSDITEYQIIIKTDYKVLNNNADKVNDNLYIWNINKENYNYKSISIEVDKEEVAPKKNTKVVAFITPIVLVILFLVVGMVLRKFANREEEL